MPKTPTLELEMFTMRVPSSLLDRARKYAQDRGVPVAHAIIEAMEIFFFHRIAPEMEQELVGDMSGLGITRDTYFRSLLDARYRQLVVKGATSAESGKRPRAK